MSSERSLHIFNARDIPIKSVTVFTDRAEITRNFKVNLKSGLNYIQLENVASTIVPNSISVDGKGNATILDIKFEAKPSNPTTDDLDKIKELKNQLKQVQSKSEAEKELNGVINSKLTALNNLLNKFTEKSDKKDEVVIFNEATESSMENLFDFYEKKVLELNKRLKEVKEKEQEYYEEIQRLQNEINQYTWNNKVKNIISIEVESETGTEGEEDELTVIYQVYGANWSPSYDLRVKNNKMNQPQMILSYYANIQQQTGEEWKDVELSLSTAQPSLGNSLPKLGSTVVQFYRPPVIQPMQMLRRGGGGGGAEKSAVAKCMTFGAALDAGVPQMRQAVTVAEESVLSTTFNIPQRKTVTSDSSKHKVTVTVVTLAAHLHYETVPKKDTKVYLMATVINNSDYPLLPGIANVYIDNSLSTTLNLQAVSPGEKFDCSLGVDKAVKVIYKPTHKFQSQSGVFTSISSSGNEQRIIVKNTKRSESINITLHEPIPKSSDEKIKVRILAPDTIKNSTKENNSVPTVGAIFDDLHNLVWTEIIQPEQEKEFIIKWAVDYPPNEKIEYVESWQHE